MKKLVQKNDLKHLFKDGQTIMVGGFMTCGTPEGLVDLLVEMNVRDLTIVCNDAGLPGKGVGKLLKNNQIKTLIASHIGLNPEAGQQMNDGVMEIQLVPQGTLAERIRAGGAGLGGILTHVGVGTIVEEEKQKIVVDGHEYLLELPLKADVTLLYASRADKAGNVHYKGTTRNFNPVMAMAGETVICEADEVVEIGKMAPEDAMTPGVLVDYVVAKGGSK